MLVGAVSTYAIRVDPLRIARENAAAQPGSQATPKRTTRTLLALPTVRRALVAAIAAQIVMTSMMSIVSLAMRMHGHRWPAIAVSMSAHFLGMFGLVLVVGPIVDRVGRVAAAFAGLVVVAAGALLLLVDLQVWYVAPAMWAVGVGWNVAFVAATAMLADATQPQERASLLGFSDFSALGSAALGAVLAGIVVSEWGLPWLAGIGAALALAGGLTIVTHRRPHAPSVVPEPRCP
jgi:MFS family permease